MTDKTRVRLRITSHSDGGVESQMVAADRYVKGGAIYYRYPEPVEAMGRTNTIVKAEPGRIRIIRQGDTEAEMSFAVGRREQSFLRAQGFRMETETETKTISVDIGEERDVLEWSYDLYHGDAPIGRFRIRLEAVH